MACPGIRQFSSGQTQCILEPGHKGFHFDEVAHWGDDSTDMDTEFMRAGGFRYKYNARDGWRHIAQIGGTF